VLANIVVCTQRKCLQIFDTDGSHPCSLQCDHLCDTLMGHVMVWARNEEFCDFGKVQLLVRSAIRAGSLQPVILQLANIVICDLAIHAILELDGDRSTDHSNWKYDVANVVCMVLHFCFTIFFYHMLFF
jgi:hypothetical protein